MWPSNMVPSRHVSMLQVSRHVSMLQVSRHISMLQVSRRMSMLQVSRHMSMLQVSRHMSMLQVSRHISMLQVSRHMSIKSIHIGWLLFYSILFHIHMLCLYAIINCHGRTKLAVEVVSPLKTQCSYTRNTRVTGTDIGVWWESPHLAHPWIRPYR